MELATVRQMNEEVEQGAAFLDGLMGEIRKVIVGQDALVDRVLVALMANGHILLEGVPGLAKTLLVKTVAESIDAQFSRVQFTPDLLPADLLGTQIYNPRTTEFSVHKGPIFANLVLADEINRAPAKVQSALLEAMQERQVTIGGEMFKLGEPFLVLATQNPIEQEGTYPLPEAQVDRFMLKVLVDYPRRDEERNIVDMVTGEEWPDLDAVISPEQIVQARGDGAPDIRRRQDQGVRPRHSGGNPPPVGRGARGPAPAHRLRGLPQGEHIHDRGSAGPRLREGPRLRDPRGHKAARARRAPSQGHHNLRGGGRGGHERRHRPAHTRPRRGALEP